MRAKKVRKEKLNTKKTKEKGDNEKWDQIEKEMFKQVKAKSDEKI